MNDYYERSKALLEWDGTMEGITMYENVCPVCGERFMGEYFEYEICPHCGWEDDPNQVEEPDFLGANGELTFNQAVKNYEETGKIR